MINFDNYVSEKKSKHNPNWSHTPDKPYRILIIGGSGSGKTNVLLNLMDNQPDIDYNSDPENKILIVFDDMIVDMINKRKVRFNSDRIVY